jgi:hypothetical protein
VRQFISNECKCGARYEWSDLNERVKCIIWSIKNTPGQTRRKFKYNLPNQAENKRLQVTVFNINIYISMFQFKNNLVFVYGKDLESKKNRFEYFIDGSVEKDDKEKPKSVVFNSKLNVGAVPVLLECNGDFKTKSSKFKLSGTYQKNDLGFTLDGKYGTRQVGDYDVSVGANFNKQNVRVNCQRQIENDKSKLTNKLTTTFGPQFQLNGHVGNKMTATDADINLESELKLSNDKEPYKYVDYTC